MSKKYCVFFIVITFICVNLYSKGIGGYFQIQWGVEDKGYLEFWKPWYNYQFRFWSDPVINTNVYGQFSANSFESFYLDRACIRYSPKNFELLGLVKEERHSLESHLLHLVDQDVASDYYRSLGLRMNMFYPKLWLSVLTTGTSELNLQEWYGKYFSYTNDTKFFRTKINVFKTQDLLLSFGTSCLQKNLCMERYLYGNIFDKKFDIYNNVVSLDTHFSFFTKDLYIETARSRLEIDDTELQGSAVACEIRNFILGPVSIASKIYSIDKNFRCLLSNRYGERAYEIGKKGWQNEIAFFIPEKLINLLFRVNIYDDYLMKTENDTELRNFVKHIYYSQPKRCVNSQTEIYTELSNGIKLRSIFDIFSKQEQEVTSSFMAELGWETTNIFPKLQIRIKDIGKDVTVNYGEKIITAVETKLNLTDRLQFYIRSLNTYGTKLAKNWYENFVQIRYYIGWDIDFYLEYGFGWDTGNLTYSWVVDEPDRKQPQVVKLYIRANLW